MVMRPIGKKMPWTCGDRTSAVDESLHGIRGAWLVNRLNLASGQPQTSMARFFVASCDGGAPVGQPPKPTHSRSISKFSKINAAQDDAGRVAFEVASDEFFRSAPFDPITQSQKLRFALIRRRP